jgi:hypothetical protein
MLTFYLVLLENEDRDSFRFSFGFLNGPDLQMNVVTGTLVNADTIDPVHNLWRLTLMIDDDSLSVRKYEVQSKYPFRNDEIRRFKLTLRGDEVIKIEPLD